MGVNWFRRAQRVWLGVLTAVALVGGCGQAAERADRTPSPSPTRSTIIAAQTPAAGSPGPSSPAASPSKQPATNTAVPTGAHSPSPTRPAPATASAAPSAGERSFAFGKPVVIAPRDCGNIAVAQQSDTTIGGFIGCNDGLRYIEGTAGRWRAVRSPYQGQILAVDADAKQTLLLFTTSSGGRPSLGRRLANGQFEPAVALGTSSAETDGAVVLSGRDWRAVWVEREAADQAASTALYEASSSFSRRRVNSASPAQEGTPHLAATDAGELRLAYDSADPASTNLVFATATAVTSAWSPMRSLHRAKSSHAPRLAVDGARTYVAFLNGVVPTLGELSTPASAMVTKDFRTDEGASNVRVAVSSGVPVIGWTAPRGVDGDGSDIDTAERREGRWYTQRFAAPGPHEDDVLRELLSARGRATGIAYGATLFARSQ